MAEIEINPQFEQVLNFINRTSQTVFLTGKAGTGKTTLLRYIRENTYKQMAVCAPTGVAAINAGGTTIHSFFQFPFAPFIPRLKENGEIDPSAGNLPTLKYNSQRLSIFRNLELLVIDEISMVRADLLDQIDITLRHTRKKWQLPFGGVQLLLIGDMHQLPPVVQNEEWRLLSGSYPSLYFFDSLVIRKNPPVYIELQKIYRQSDHTFIELLNKVRHDEMDEATLERLNSHYKGSLSQQDYAENITLTTHNRKADEINARNMDELPGKLFLFRAEIKGQFSEKSYPAAENLELKKGARVMFLKNNAEKNYYNGKIGIVTYIDDEKLKVKCEEDKKEIEVVKEIWTNVSYKLDKATKHIDEDVLGTFMQYPLRPAWAITIHKSQGLTFDKLIIDAAEAFSAGQVYVALSRCRSLDGLTLSSRIGKESLFNDNKILGFASGRQDEAQLNTILESARSGYIKNILLSLFDLTELSDSRKELAGLMQLHSMKVDKAGREWAQRVYEKTDQLQAVALKFRQQLLSLAEATGGSESDKTLQERVSKASVYFMAAFDELLAHFKKMTLRSESKEAATDLNELLQPMFELIFTKRELLAGCTRGFELDTYVKNKLAIRYPATRINVYATASNSKVAADVKHPALYRELLFVRDAICNEDHKPIYLVANAKTLTALANFLPENEEQLLTIPGFGKAKAEDFGERFLEVIRAYKSEHNISTEFEFKPSRKKKEKLRKSEEENEEPVAKTPGKTREISFQMLMAGKTPAEIAKERGFTEGTILGHFAPYISSGELDVDRFVPKEKQAVIVKALDDFTAENGLGSIKTTLPEDITYSDIKLVQAALKARVN